jgi:crotonobetainyl-CoA:carnitine CoA-transferase CaiB-like acyl-CoA transferase/DNA-binding beta-propeller fold protein YncE
MNATLTKATTTQTEKDTTGRIFFLDLGGGRVLSANPDGSDLRTIIEEGRDKLPDGLAIDVAAGHIYWTNMGNFRVNDGSILRSDLDGRNMTTIVPPGGTFTPKQLQIEKTTGKLYWCDREGMRVMRSNLDGSHIETLVDSSQGDPRPGSDATKQCVGIAVDVEGGKLYWTQKGETKAGQGRLFRANIEIPPDQTASTRQDIELLYDALPEPIDLDIDPTTRTLYWTDRGDPPRGNTVNRAPLDAPPEGRPDPEIVFKHLMEGIGLALDLEGGRMFITDFAGSVYTANLNGSDKKTLLVAQGNLTGIAYAELPVVHLNGRPSKNYTAVSSASARSVEANGSTDRLTEGLEYQLSHPATSPDFDLHRGVNEVLADVGMTTADSGGKLSFYGADPILPSPHRFGTMAALGMAARSVALAALRRQTTGEGQDISLDVRKALRRFCGFFDLKWETINGRPPSGGPLIRSPFFDIPFFRETRDGRHVIALDFYPQLRARTLNFLRCSENSESINNAIRKWDAVELEEAAAEAGLVMAMVRTNEEFRRELQYTEVLSKTPLITVEKIGDSEPVPLKASGDLPLEGIRAFGMGHVIAGGAIGRDLALYGADVLNIWRPHDTEVDAFAWDVQVGMRSTILGDSKEDRAQFQRLLELADVFFANKRPGFLARHGLDSEELCARKPGLIHATVVLHGEKGPWSNRPGFDEVGAAVSGLFALEGSPTRPKQPPIVPICDNVVAWLGTTGILAALRRRAIEGGSYRVVISLTRVVLWLLSLGMFDKAYAQATAGSTDEHRYAEPDLFTAETPCGTYQGMTDQVVLSRTPGSFRTVLVPRGSSKPEWLV